jgi:hypothetical protein
MTVARLIQLRQAVQRISQCDLVFVHLLADPRRLLRPIVIKDAIQRGLGDFLAGRLNRDVRDAGPAAALVALVSAAAPTLANDTVGAGVGGTSITVNGTTISTSEIDLEELGALQGVPASTVKLELEEVAAETPERTAVDAIVSRLAADTPLATALADLSTASGGAISPARALTSVVAQNGHPGASGSTGTPGQSGAGAGTGQPSTTTAHNL